MDTQKAVVPTAKLDGTVFTATVANGVVYHFGR